MEKVVKEHELNAEITYIGGISIGGNIALILSDYLNQSHRIVEPKGVSIIDSPIHLFSLDKSSLKEIPNPNFDEERFAETK